MRKGILRKNILAKMDNLGENVHKINSKIIINRILESNFYKKASTIMVYVSFKNEINTHNFIKKAIGEGKNILVPITLPKENIIKPSHLQAFEELEEGYYEILSPKSEFIRYVDPQIIDLVMVPGLVFDRKGYRIGYGGGYYDRFLENLPSTKKISLAFDFQVLEDIPKEGHDIPVDLIYTENEIITCN